MPAITIRNLSPEAHRALKVRAARHGRSTEAEVRNILEQMAMPQDRVKLGTLLVEVGRQAGLAENEASVFKEALERDRLPADPVKFE